ncbi:hypothetical protein ES705_27639 [subsurface metagenome]
MTEEIKLVKVEYYRQVKAPTLKQYLYRRAVQEAMATVKGKTGVTIPPDTGIPIPESALAAREALKGLTAEKILAGHPEWEEDYDKDNLARR